MLWPAKPIDFCRVAGDAEALHFGALHSGQLVAVASIFIDGQQARLRKFAALPAYQGRGIGSTLLRHILDTLHTHSITYFWCDARATATTFYERFGMQVEGPRFYKADVAYFKMSKLL